MDYITTKQAAAKWGVTDRMVLYYCTLSRINGAVKMGNLWLIPKNSIKPIDRRKSERKEGGTINESNSFS
ncbi:MAG: DNA-binding protein [Lachnospiraceae bacterium]